MNAVADVVFVVADAAVVVADADVSLAKLNFILHSLMRHTWGRFHQRFRAHF